MGTIFVMVGDVIREQAFQVAFNECDDVIQQVPAAAAYPAQAHFARCAALGQRSPLVKFAPRHVAEPAA
jgi:hypothetical protein